jgi:hypothetical protein
MSDLEKLGSAVQRTRRNMLKMGAILVPAVLAKQAHAARKGPP